VEHPAPGSCEERGREVKGEGVGKGKGKGREGGKNGRKETRIW